MGNCSIFTYLDIDHRERLFGSTIVSGNSVYCFRNIVQHQIKIDFIFLKEFIKNRKNKIRNQYFIYSEQNLYTFTQIFLLLLIHTFKIHAFNSNYTKVIQNIVITVKTSLLYLFTNYFMVKNSHFNTAKIFNYT